MTDTVDIGELKPSELIRHALRDLERVEEDPAYIVDMDEWHVYFAEDEAPWTCSVCLAGAVMAKTLSVDVQDSRSPFTLARARIIDQRTLGALLALDHLRAGDVEGGLEAMNREPAVPDCRIEPYEVSPEQFYEDMGGLADRLEAAGL